MAPIGDMHHVGITVRDLEESLQWYERDVRRPAGVHRAGFRARAGDGGRGAGRELRFAFLRFGSCVVELLGYDNEREDTFHRSNADVGSTHVCIDVPDLQKSYDDLRRKGVEFFAPPLHIDDGPLGGLLLRLLQGPQRRDSRALREPLAAIPEPPNG